MIMDDGGGDDDDCHGFGGSDDTADLLALLFRKKLVTSCSYPSYAHVES